MNVAHLFTARADSTFFLIVLALVSIGCTSEPSGAADPPATPPSNQPTEPTERPIHGDPLPGSFYLTSDPPLAPYALTIRVDDIGGPSGRSAQFGEGDEIAVNWSTLPLPHEKWVEVNGQDCEGTFGIRARFETDLSLVLTDDGCRVEVLGSHPEGGRHHCPTSKASARADRCRGDQTTSVQMGTVSGPG